MTRTGATARPAIADADADSILDFFRTNTRLLVIGGVIVVAAALGFWFYTQSRRIRTANAERTLMSAQQSMAQNNLPLAQNDLQTVVTRYNGTPAAVQAALLLAQLHYDQGQYQQGIDVLERVADTRPAEPMRAAVYALIGDGYLELGQPVEAAQRYREAADDTGFENDRDVYRSQAARALVAAGDTSAAVEIWRGLAEDPESAVAAEAKVRLGELTVDPLRGG